MGDLSKLTKNKNVLLGKNAAIFLLKFTGKHKIHDFLPEFPRTSNRQKNLVGLSFNFSSFFVFTSENSQKVELFSSK